MGKYNITEKKEKEAAYRSLVSPRMMDVMQEKILNIIVMQKKYRDKDYSAKKLAEDLGTNTRYISAVVNVRFHTNYTSFVNKYRIDEAMSILVDKRYQKDPLLMIGLTPCCCENVAVKQKTCHTGGHRNEENDRFDISSACFNSRTCICMHRRMRE